MLILILLVGLIFILAALNRASNRVVDSQYHPDFDEDGSNAGPKK